MARKAFKPLKIRTAGSERRQKSVGRFKTSSDACILGEMAAYLLGTFDTDAHLKPASLAPAAKGRRQRRRL